MLTLEQVNHYIDLAKTFCQSTMFAAFGQPAWKSLFDYYLAKVFIPVIMLGLISQACHAIETYHKNTKKSPEQTLKLGLQLLAMACILTTMSLRLAAIHFSFMPYLFLTGITIMIGTRLPKIIDAITKLNQTDKSADRKVLWDQLCDETVNLLGKIALLVTILTAFIIPVGPSLKLICALSASAFLAVEFTTKLIEGPKQHHSTEKETEEEVILSQSEGSYGDPSLAGLDQDDTAVLSF